MWLLTIPVLFVIGWFSPWWLLVVLALVAGFSRRDLSRSAGAGFLVASFVWGLLIVIFEFRSHGLVSHRLAELFGINNTYLFVAVVTVSTGLVGAVSGLLGQWLRRLMFVPR